MEDGERLVQYKDTLRNTLDQLSLLKDPSFVELVMRCTPEEVRVALTEFYRESIVPELLKVYPDLPDDMACAGADVLCEKLEAMRATRS